jgi:hypothetical protein
MSRLPQQSIRFPIGETNTSFVYIKHHLEPLHTNLLIKGAFVLTLNMINFCLVGELSSVMDQNLGEGDLLFRETRCLLPSHAFPPLVVDFEQLIDLLKRESCCLNVEVIDDGNPDEVQCGEDNVKLPADIGNSCAKMLMDVLRNYSILIMSPN